MQEAAALFERERHHPRWSNEWKLVILRLSTWDAGNKITTRDVEVAMKVDDLIRDFRRRQRLRHAV
jgi:4a-hydroxytetrahydrobiopterin dehydratase